MATTNFVNGTLIVPAWLNDVDAMTYDQTIAVPWKTITWTNATVTHSGAHIWSGAQTWNAAVVANGTFTCASTFAISTGIVTSGQYTPTLTNNTNISASVANANTTYMRVGNVVSVAGSVTITPTANSVATTLYISLPIASALTANGQLAGTATRTGGGLTNLSAIVIVEAAGDQASLTFLNDADSGVARTWAFNFQYVVV